MRISKKRYESIKSKIENNIETFTKSDESAINVFELRYILGKIKNLNRYKVFVPDYETQRSNKINNFYPLNFIDIFNYGEITLHHNFGKLTTEDTSEKSVEDNGKTLLGNLTQYEFGNDSIIFTNDFLLFDYPREATKVIIDSKEKTIKIL